LESPKGWEAGNQLEAKRGWRLKAGGNPAFAEIFFCKNFPLGGLLALDGSLSSLIPVSEYLQETNLH